MVARHSEATKLKEAKTIAKEANCFILERIEKVPGKTGGLINRTSWLLYRLGEPRNIYIGKRTSVSGIVCLVRKATEGTK